MINRRPPVAGHRPSPRLRGTGLLACLALLALCGCQEPLAERYARDGDAFIPAIPHPQVERDLPDIQDQGALRMITRYDSRGYLIHKGGEAGFHFELMRMFARENGLLLEVVIPGAGEDPISLLNGGQGDVVASGMVQTPVLGTWAAPTRPTNFVQKAVVWRPDPQRPEGLAGLAGMTLTLPYGDLFRDPLLDIRRESGVHFFVGAGRPGATTEMLLTQVSTGDLDAVAVDDILARAARAYLPDLEIGPSLGERLPTVWLVRQNSPELRNALNAFLQKNIRVDEEGIARRSQNYGIIYDRYFENPKTIRGFQAPEDRPDKSGRISQFDEQIKGQAEGLGLDWRMAAALIYQESRFLPEARSQADARGLMQVMPQFAGDMADSLYEIEPNLRVGLQLLGSIFDRFAYLDSLDRWRFTLAEYHAGHGHLTDARRLAMDLGRDPNAWEGGLADTLPLLMQRRYYKELPYGYYRGAETVAYVEEILNRYRMYTRVVPRREDDAGGEGPDPDLYARDRLPGLVPQPDPD